MQHGPGLSPAARRVADYIDRNRLEVLAHSALELAALIGASDATVVRTVQALGFAGLQDLRRHLMASLSGQHDLAADMERALDEVSDSAGKAMAEALDVAKAGHSVLEQADMRQRMGEALRLLNPARRIAVFGIGPTGFLAGYMCHRLQREGRASVLLDQTGIALADQLLALRKGDIGLLLAYGAPYPEVETAAERIRRLGGRSVLISDSAVMAQSIRPQVFLQLPRGLPDRVAFHGTTMACIEMLLFGLASCRRAATLESLANLKSLRAELAGPARRRVPRKRAGENSGECM